MNAIAVHRPMTVRSSRTAAFTLLELIVSLAILAILAAHGIREDRLKNEAFTRSDQRTANCQGRLGGFVCVNRQLVG